MVKKIDFTILIRWAWLLSFLTVIGGAAALLFTLSRPALYEAQAKLLVGPGIDSPNPDLNVLRAGGQLIQVYAELPLTQPQLEQVITELGLYMTPAQLASLIEISPNQATQILTVQVTYTDPEQAKAIASTIASHLVKISPSNPEGTSALIKNQVQTQVVDLEQTISGIKGNIQQLESDYQNALAAEQGAQDGLGSGKSVIEQLNQFEENKAALSDAAVQKTGGKDILDSLVTNSNARLNQFEAELQKETNTLTQKLVSDQIREERNHSSQLQQAIAEIERPVNGIPLDQYITETNGRIDELGQNLSANLDLRKIQIDQIALERENLGQARVIESARQKLILDSIAQERDRVSQVGLAKIEKKRLILEQIASERVLLSETQNTLALLYDSSRQADPNQVKIIELPTQAVPVSSSPSLAMIIGALAALLLGVVGVIAFEAFDDHLRTSAQAVKIAPGLVVDADENPGGVSSLLSEKRQREKYLQKYQMLSLNMLYRQGGANAQLIMLAAADAVTQPGTSALGLGVHLAQSGKRVILIDANFGNSFLASFFRLEKREGLSELLASPTMKQPQLVTVDGYPTLAILPYGNTRIEPSLLASPKMFSQLDRLLKHADFVLCCVPELNRSESMVLASHANSVILVTRKGATSQQAYSGVIANLGLTGANILATIFEPKLAPVFLYASMQEAHYFPSQQLQQLVRQELTAANPVELDGNETVSSSSFSS